MGSRTFYDMASYWPYSTEPFAAPMNEIPKVVFSKKGVIESISDARTTTALKDASRINATQGMKNRAAVSPMAFTAADTKVAGGDLGEEIARLKQQPGKDILAHGGATFAQSLAKLGLIDEYRLLTHPVLLGTGLPLFSAIPKPVDLKLVSATPFKSGTVAHVYQPA
jgi:dihydrofolate reductase